MELREYILNNMDNLDIDIETMNKISDFILEFEENRKTQKCNMCMYCNNSPEEKDNLFFCFNIHTPVRLIGNKDKTLNFGCDFFIGNKSVNVTVEDKVLPEKISKDCEDV